MKKYIKIFLLLVVVLGFSLSINYASNLNISHDFGTTHALYDQTSYLGFMNHLYEEDDGTRLYILPKNEVTTGLGGALKIFADPFHENKTDYRDLGIYFYQDQKDDKGYNGNGVYWINSKASGKYYGKNPDIAFSFQDGSAVAGRFTYFFETNSQPRTAFVVGEGHPKISNNAKSVKLEMQGDIGLRNNDMIRWTTSNDQANSGIRFDNTNDLDFIIQGQSVLKLSNMNDSNKKIKLNGSLVFNTKDDNLNNPQIDVNGINVITIKNTENTSINNFINGHTGQEITIIFDSNYTTIRNNSNIRLQNASDFNPKKNDTIKLVFNGEAWYEVSRSIN